MKIWPVQDAKARFSQLLEDCLNEGPQIVSRRGTESAVLVSMEEWNRLSQRAPRSLKDILLSSPGKGELTLPSRGNARRRQPPVL